MTNYKINKYTRTHINQVGEIVKVDFCCITEILLRSTTRIHQSNRNIAIFKILHKKLVIYHVDIAEHEL